jgi:hypothetical protein
VGDALLQSWWLGPLLWAVLYVSDYSLTIACARLYRAQDKVVFEGSYEITPIFQADVDALRRVSPRFMIILVVSTVYLFLVGSLSRSASRFSGVYLFVLGAMILTEATVHIRHVRNWYLFRKNIGLLKGRLEYPRGALLCGSALEISLFAALYAGLYVVTRSIFVLGGAAACGALAIKHLRLARRHEATASKAAQETGE